MNKVINTFVVLTIFLFPAIKAQTVCENLKILKPLLNKTWVGELKSPDGSKENQSTQTYIVLWDGTVVKFTGSTPGLNANSEGYFYWDRQEQKVGVIIINNKGIYQKGFVTLEEVLSRSLEKSHFPKEHLILKTVLNSAMMVT